MAKTKKINKPSFKVSPSYKQPEEICEHRWHLAKSLENFITRKLYTVFICSECGKVKRIESQEEY